MNSYNMETETKSYITCKVTSLLFKNMAMRNKLLVTIKDKGQTNSRKTARKNNKRTIILKELNNIKYENSI